MPKVTTKKTYLIEDEPVESHAEGDNKEDVCEGSSAEEEEVNDGLEVDTRSARPLRPAPRLVARIQHAERAQHTVRDTEITLVVVWVIVIFHCESYLKSDAIGNCSVIKICTRAYKKNSCISGNLILPS